MAEHPDAERFRRALAARRSGTLAEDDRTLLEALFADDVTWNGVDGAVRGKGDVLDRWNALARDRDVELDVGDVWADGNHTVAVLELSGGDGDRQTIRQLNIFHMSPDGKATEFWGLPAQDQVVEALRTGTDVPEHPHMERFRTAEDARERWTFEPEDIAAIEAFLREDVVWHGAGRIFTQDIVSRAAVFEMYKFFKSVTTGTMNMEIFEKFIDDHHAASLVRLTATRDERPGEMLDLREVNLFHVDENGRCYEYWGIAPDQDEVDDFWS